MATARVIGLVFLLASFADVPPFRAETQPPATEPEKAVLSVCVSILPQAAFVERIGGSLVDVQVMVGPGQSPATYDPTLKQMVRMAKADAYFAIGVPMEEVLLPQLRGNHPELRIVQTGEDETGERNPHPNGVASSASAAPTTPADHGHRQNLQGQAHRHDTDPHIWLDPLLAKLTADRIRAALQELDPAHADRYRENFRQLAEDLDRLDLEIAEILRPVAGQELLVFHPAFGHFARRYGLKQVAIESGGLEPTPKHLASVLELAKARGIRSVFVQPQFSESSARTVAKQSGMTVVSLDPLAKDYLANMRRIALAVREALEIK